MEVERKTKKQIRDENILRHGSRLIRIFNVQHIGPVELCKKLHRIEARAHRIAEDYCNGYIDHELVEEKEDSILASLDSILNFTEQKIPVKVNLDPRGYALKIEDEYIRANNVEIYRDWGGYGILAPEF